MPLWASDCSSVKQDIIYKALSSLIATVRGPQTRAVTILADTTRVVGIWISAHFQTVHECKQDTAPGSEGETDDVIEVIYY